jgi:asparagine synthase (glutamine-hydrolysing)
MYAFGLWDEQEHRLVLARDPYGIKPLYYTAEGGYLRFASQVKALEAGGAVSREVDPAGVAGFLMWGSVPEPYTIRRAVRALPAGHYLAVEAGRPAEPKQYRSIEEAVDQPAATCKSALMDTVRAHLVADVPVAIFLSAGLDSGLLAALACRHLPEPPDTLTIRFQRFIGTPYDEGPLAAEVARRLGTHHTERLVSRQDFPDLWAKVIRSMDQPSIDGFNTYVVSALAREAGLKVVLSGLGGDELLGGYRSFQEVPHWAWWVRRGEWIPV